MITCINVPNERAGQIYCMLYRQIASLSYSSKQDLKPMKLENGGQGGPQSAPMISGASMRPQLRRVDLKSFKDVSAEARVANMPRCLDPTLFQLNVQPNFKT